MRDVRLLVIKTKKTKQHFALLNAVIAWFQNCVPLCDTTLRKFEVKIYFEICFTGNKTRLLRPSASLNVYTTKRHV